MSTSSVISGRCCPRAATAILSARISAAPMAAIALTRSGTLIRFRDRLEIQANCNARASGTSTFIYRDTSSERGERNPVDSGACPKFKIFSAPSLRSRRLRRDLVTEYSPLRRRELLKFGHHLLAAISVLRCATMLAFGSQISPTRRRNNEYEV